MLRLLLSVAVLVISARPCLPQSYMIAPLSNGSPDHNLNWIGESVSEVVREALARNGVPVFSRRSREEKADQLSLEPGGPLTEASAMRLAMEVGAQRVVFGRFERVEGGDSPSALQGRLRIQARVVDVADITRVADIVEEGVMADLGELQARVAWRVLSIARGPDTPSLDKFLEEYPPVRLDAMESYVRGLMASTADLQHRYFAQAARMAPEFSPPRFQLGRMQWDGKSYKVAAEWLSAISDTDSHYLEANFLLGLCLYHTGDYERARSAFELVARHVPSPEVYNNLGIVQFRYRDEEAILNLFRAAQADPGDADYRFNIGYVLWRQGDLDGARQRFENVLTMQPDDGDALALLERCIELRGPRIGDLTSEGMERLKTTYSELAFQQLRSASDSIPSSQ